MKLPYSLLIFIMLFTFHVSVEAQVATKLSSTDSINPYFHKDVARPYHLDPRKWHDYIEYTSEIEILELASKAEIAGDFYKLFQLATQPNITNNEKQIQLLTKIKNYAYLEKDPWLLFYLSNYILINHHLNTSSLNHKFIASSAYTIACYRKDSELLRRIARLYTETNFMEGISYQEIIQKANEIDGGILPNYSQSRNSRFLKSEGMALEGNITHGYGKKRYTKKTEFADIDWIYEGDFLEEYENFIGNLYDSQGNLVYVGQWDKGLFVGNGRLSSADGTFYEGEFLDGKFHGHGSLFDKEGNLFYSGKFENGKMNGIGRFIFKIEESYYGAIENGLMSGKGTYFFKNGDRYEGDFANHLKNGWGKLINANNILYFEGAFFNDEAIGKGILYNHAEGSRLEGTFAKMTPHGQMKYILKDGTIIMENWVNGKKIYNTKDEIALTEHLIALSMKEEICPEKISTKHYSIEFCSKPNKIQITDSIKEFTLENNEISSIFTEIHAPGVHFSSAENAQIFLEKFINTKNFQVINDNTFISNKKDMWHRVINYTEAGKYNIISLYLDHRDGKYYKIQHYGIDRKLVDKAHLEFKQNFITE
jgi:hypothetical protein